MGNPWCETCKEEVDAETNESNGFTCCTQCGKILDDNVFSTDPTFSKTAGGASQVRSACRETREFSQVCVCAPFSWPVGRLYPTAARGSALEDVQRLRLRIPTSCLRGAPRGDALVVPSPR